MARAVERRPTLLNSCARAATAAEARFRIPYPNSTTRASRIIALDQAALDIVDRIANGPWLGARFLAFERAVSDGGDGPPDALLRSWEGEETRLSDELEGADVAVMVATEDGGARAAEVIGRASFARRIMTAGLVVGEDGAVDDAVRVLRPYASVLVVSSDEQYVHDVLTALRT
jgi:hypothetical protein